MYIAKLSNCIDCNIEFTQTGSKGIRCDKCRILRRRSKERESYHKHFLEKRDIWNEQGSRSYMNVKNRDIKKVRYNNLKFRCQRDNIDFDLIFEELIWPEFCPVFGIPLDDRDRNYSPTFDRVDNDKGYIKGNVNIISGAANRKKQNSTIEELSLIIKYIKNHYQSIYQPK